MFAARHAIRPTVAAAAVALSSPLVAQARGYATLKESEYLEDTPWIRSADSISNIAKITKSMKMIASTKVNKAQRNMETARVFGTAGTALFKHTETPDATVAKPLVVAVSSDRGLCGGIHSAISKGVKRYVATVPETAIAILGQKARTQIQREYRTNIAITFDQVAKNVPTWTEAAIIGDNILASGIEADGATIFYNQFKSVIAYETSTISVPSTQSIAASPKIAAYEVDDHILKNFQEFAFANSLFWAISEGYASEMAAKRTAMENATKNAGEMITKLTLTYNRSRQAAITNELLKTTEMGGALHNDSDHDDTAPPKMYISQEDMAKEKIPLAFRDYCAHLLPELNKCRIQNFYLPWTCEKERVAWSKCQYDDYQRRMRLLEKTKRLAAERKAAASEDA
ncbi:atp3 gamma subunit of the F1 sector of mitochondrial F1F0 ATP synthase [Dinochytrium kinnereticum]|nr:atp3 gamma subunit of the F1 sector of mitochondrial F1F0 ATP synthase [Dinochytrium kinnereticum]